MEERITSIDSMKKERIFMRGRIATNMKFHNLH